MKNVIKNSKVVVKEMTVPNMDTEIIKFQDLKMVIVLIMIRKSASSGMIDVGDGSLYGEINSCLLKGDQIQPLRTLYPHEFNSRGVIKGEEGFVASSIFVQVKENLVVIDAELSWNHDCRPEKKYRRVNTEIPISDGWTNFSDVFG